MPRKIRELISDLERAGFVLQRSKGSHRVYKHSKGVTVTISGKRGADAKPYQERDVRLSLRRVK
ncbi:MAG: addiction module toxin, HicA family [Gemmatimonadetes bacterium]|nr:addiction module toxin, HicA family [Gemmatimonadota bacterium]MXY81690.1 addiction module toxin, HicA family [Gemmatimonadota bacterium]MYB67838.1 addiction module toxin, HicA family [Gemmatimonadota bacterium]MYK41479.1 addiction module toxin, HicA family [Gemmatimonadota bacterium]